jgi:uncharacterized membrane protein YqjE
MSDAGGAWWSRLRRLTSNLVSLLNVRLDLAVVETELFVGGLIEELLLGIAGVLLLVLALAFVGLAIVWAVDEAHRLAALGLVAGGYLFGAGLCLMLIRRRRRSRGTWLAVTRAELRADAQMLSGDDE